MLHDKSAGDTDHNSQARNPLQRQTNLILINALSKPNMYLDTSEQNNNYIT
jgi:hypothetical protein